VSKWLEEFFILHDMVVGLDQCYVVVLYEEVILKFSVKWIFSFCCHCVLTLSNVCAFLSCYLSSFH